MSSIFRNFFLSLLDLVATIQAAMHWCSKNPCKHLRWRTLQQFLTAESLQLYLQGSPSYISCWGWGLCLRLFNGGFFPHSSWNFWQNSVFLWSYLFNLNLWNIYLVLFLHISWTYILLQKKPFRRFLNNNSSSKIFVKLPRKYLLQSLSCKLLSCNLKVILSNF